ncbi:MAG: proline--tRNA ligase [Spirochaetaceae bacterium]
MPNMKYSQLFGKTLRNIRHEVKSEGHALLVRGGFLRPLGNGLFSYLPLGYRVIKKLMNIIREEMNALNGQEVMVPLINPREIWERSGRDRLIGEDMVRFTDRTERELVLAPSHEEAFVELVRVGLRSYRDLPVFLYQFQHKFRDEERTRNGLLRAREFIMKDAYSFHRSYTGLNNFFPKVFSAYTRIFQRCGLDVEAAESGVGYMGGEKACEFLIPCELGGDILVRCTKCGYRANRNVAMGYKEYSAPSPKPMFQIDTPNTKTMEELSDFLGLPKEKLAKTMVFKTLKGIVMAVVRGDYEVSSEKLSRYLEEPILGIANEEELEELGFVPGYLSPVDLEKEIRVVVDGTVARSTNLVIGGNKEGVHYKDANFGRDFSTQHVADISMIKEENTCLQCGGKLEQVRALELGNIFKLDDFYTRSMDLVFQEEKGNAVFPQMGSYGIGIGRLIGALAEKKHDSRGLLWPAAVAPFLFFLMGIGKSHSVNDKVMELYAEMGEDTLLDDRKESPGVKFKDADLMGIPYRIVLSQKRYEQGEAEFYERQTRKSWYVPLDEVIPTVEKLRSEVQGEAQ